jgi:uncharacterized BrkB/YihY/UPF0761 family membrane protein
LGDDRRLELPGAVGAGVLFESVTLLFPLYFQATQAGGATAALLALPFLLGSFFTLRQITVIGELINLELAPEAQSVPHRLSAVG